MTEKLYYINYSYTSNWTVRKELRIKSIKAFNLGHAKDRMRRSNLRNNNDQEILLFFSQVY